MNEPVAPGVSVDSLKNYYTRGYNAVRKHSTTAYVIMSTRLSASSAELVNFASGFRRVVLDVHYYALFDGKFDSFSVQQNIDYVRDTFANDLKLMTTRDGPLTFIGKCVMV